MKKKDKSLIQSEYDEFVSLSLVDPEPNVGREVLDSIEKKLNPSPFNVFGKLLGVHAGSSILTLSLCSQFGVKIGGGHGIMSLFMLLGPQACFVMCGGFFIALSIVVAKLFLAPSEWRVYWESQLLQLSGLVLLSLGALWMLNAELVLSLVLFWVLGVMGTGTFIGWKLSGSGPLLKLQN